MAETLDEIFGPVTGAQPKQGQKQSLDDIFGPVRKAGDNPRDEILPPRGMEVFQPQEGVDYETGIPLHQRYNLYLHSGSPGPGGLSEQEKYLQSTFGPGNYRKGSAGDWQVKANNFLPSDAGTAKWVSAYPKKTWGNLMENAGIGIAGAVPTTLGAVGGAALGAPGGPPGMAVGAGIGAGVGDLAQEGFKALQGTHNKSFMDQLMHTGSEMALNTAFQGVPYLYGGAKAGAINALARRAGSITDVTPERRQIAQGLDRLGVAPPLTSTAPGLTSWEYWRQMRQRLMGDPMLEPRVTAVNTRIGEVLDKIPGVSPMQRDAAVAYINDVTSNSRPGDTGALVRQALMERENTQLGAAEAAQQRARQLIQAQQTALLRERSTSQRGLMDLGHTLSDAYRASKQDFTTNMDAVYQAVHDAAGGKPVVDLSGALDSAQNLMNPTPYAIRKIAGLAEQRAANEMPPDSVAPDATVDEIAAVMKWMAEKNAAGKPPMAGAGVEDAAEGPVLVTIEEAHKLRSQIREMARMTGSLSPMGPRRYELTQLAEQIDAALEKTAVETGGTVKDLMDAADAQYKQGVVRYTNNDVNQIIESARQGRPPDPDTIADLVFHKNGVAAARQIIETLPPHVADLVRTADTRNMLLEATSRSAIGPGGERALDPDKLTTALDRREMLHEALYSRNDPFVRRMRELVVDMKALDGAIDPFRLTDAFRSGNSREIGNALRTAVQERARLEMEVAHDARAALRADSHELQEQGARFIIKSEARTRRAMQILTPAERQVFEREAATEIIRAAMQPIGRKEQGLFTISGSHLREAAALTPAQRNMVMSPAVQQDIDLLVRETNALFPERGNDMGTSLAAAVAKSQSWLNPKKVKTFATAWIAGRLADDPAVIRQLTGTMRADPYRGRRLWSYILQGSANVGMAGANQASRPDPTDENDPFNANMRAMEQVHKPTPKVYQGVVE